MIIGLLGAKRHGKDTVADYLVEAHGFTKITFATPLKECCGAMFGFTDEQLYGDLKDTVDESWGITPRDTFKFIGTDLVREHIHKLLPDIGNNFWVESLKRTQLSDKTKNYVISDVRFQNEVDFVKEMGGTVIKIIRPNMPTPDEHITEAGIYSVTGFDDVVMNDGTIAELHEKISCLLQEKNIVSV